ncbi:MAG TPA: glycogen debranching protein [Peptococcaceae bacterium]|nr:glycogen debranching protein [Peptococcaceae bacterium]
MEKEWLVTNGLGGFASGALIGANARRYHGLLVAALRPPTRRVLLWAKLEERLVAAGETYNLAANQTRAGVTDAGFWHLQRVVVDPLPTFTYSFGDITLEKTVFMVHGRNTTVVRYRVKNGARPATLWLTPLVNCRDFHGNTYRGQVDFEATPLADGVKVRGLPDVPALVLFSTAGEFHCRPDWYYGMFYALEDERGLNPVEDHFMPGSFAVELAPGEEKVFSVTGSTGEERVDPEAALVRERERLAALVDRAGYDDELARCLVASADAFIVRRESTGAATVIAGYPWFTDWGRDAMIALPGLTLVTRRFAEAKEILYTFARYARRGLIPNTFPDAGGEPWYNTVDAPLWYFQAVHKYLAYTNDHDFVCEEIFPVLQDIIAGYVDGTDFNIHMDEDGLITAGSPGVQLTWMDAKVGDWVVTPRHGKPVEVQALWYNALCLFDRLAARYGRRNSFRGLPPRVRDGFVQKFWYNEGRYLYDILGEDGPDAALRPNQILALSLAHPILGPDEGRRVLHAVWRELYATYGLRSLAPGDPAYRGVYRGDVVARDGAYHQGTTWGWLIGPFITAFRRVHGYSEASRRQAAAFVAPFKVHLRDHGIGFVAEIFDGNEPIVPRGCPAQAWSTAELLRAYVEDVLERGARDWA